MGKLAAVEGANRRGQSAFIEAVIASKYHSAYTFPSCLCTTCNSRTTNLLQTFLIYSLSVLNTYTIIASHQQRQHEVCLRLPVCGIDAVLGTHRCGCRCCCCSRAVTCTGRVHFLATIPPPLNTIAHGSILTIVYFCCVCRCMGLRLTH